MQYIDDLLECQLKNISLGCTFLFRVFRRASTHSFERRRKRALWRLWRRRPRPTWRPRRLTRRPQRGQPPTGGEGAPNGRGSGRAQYQSDVLNVPLCQGKPTEHVGSCLNMSDLV